MLIPQGHLLRKINDLIDFQFVLDETNGTATIKVDVSSVLPAEEDKALTVAVNIKNDISDFTTEFVPVYVAPAPVASEYFVDLGVKDANGNPLYWAEKNLGASKPEEYGKYFSWGDVTGQTPSESTFSKSFVWVSLHLPMTQQPRLIQAGAPRQRMSS